LCRCCRKKRVFLQLLSIRQNGYVIYHI